MKKIARYRLPYPELILGVLAALQLMALPENPVPRVNQTVSQTTV